MRTPTPERAVRISRAPQIGAVVTVLAPVLAGTAAFIFLLAGYLLKLLDPAPSFASTMVSAGWFFAAVTAAAILVAAVGLLITALRNGSAAQPVEDDEEELPEDVARAREAWRHALLERGILPFLRDALADPDAGPASRTPVRSANRIPKIGYSPPDFSSPDDGPAAAPGRRSPHRTSPAPTSAAPSTNRTDRLPVDAAPEARASGAATRPDQSAIGR